MRTDAKIQEKCEQYLRRENQRFTGRDKAVTDSWVRLSVHENLWKRQSCHRQTSSRKVADAPQGRKLSNCHGN